MYKTILKAGAAKVDITPPLGTVINGEFTSRYATRIADRLYSKALVLGQGSIKIAIVLVDTCAMRRDFIQEVKQLIHQETGIEPQRQLIASTHTHSGGSVADLLMGHVDEAYRKTLAPKIAESVKNAAAGAMPAQVGFGSINQPQYLLSRRYKMKAGYRAGNPVTGECDNVKTNPFGAEEFIVEATSTPDPALQYMALRGVNGEWIGVLANYCLHYVGDCERGTISADYFGRFADALADKLGTSKKFVGLLSNGTSGEINIWDFVNPNRFPAEAHKKSELIGSDLATALVHSTDTITWEDNPVIASMFSDIQVKTRKPSAVEIEKAKQVVATTDYENIRFGEPDFLRQVYAREQLLLASYPDTITFPVQSFKIGNAIIGALGGEFFSETGLKLKTIAPTDRYFTICLANDYVGYVPPAHEMEKGGYECWRCRTSYLAEEAEEIIKTELMQQIQSYSNRS